MADAAVAAGLPAVGRPASAEVAKKPLPRHSKIARPGDLVLVKGSRGIGTDLVVDRLRVEFA